MFIETSSNLNMFYVATLSTSALAFLYLKKKWEKKVPEPFFWIHFFIVSWSALMYLNLVFKTPLAPYAYYADWIVSTPLIMLALSFTALYPLTNINWNTVLPLMMTQAMIIVTGILAHISPTNAGKLVFFNAGNILMLLVFYFVFGPLMKIAKQNQKLFHKYRSLTILLVFFWISYPVIWIIGTPGYQIISPTMTSLLFVILPILCKPVFGFIDLYMLKSIED